MEEKLRAAAEQLKTLGFYSNILEILQDVTRGTTIAYLGGELVKRRYYREYYLLFTRKGGGKFYVGQCPYMMNQEVADVKSGNDHVEKTKLLAEVLGNFGLWRK
jgi:hypothetical protein